MPVDNKPSAAHNINEPQIDKWAPLQNPKEDIPPNMVRVPKEELKKEMPKDLIVLRDRNGRKRILVPKSQRTRNNVACQG